MKIKQTQTPPHPFFFNNAAALEYGNKKKPALSIYILENHENEKTTVRHADEEHVNRSGTM